TGKRAGPFLPTPTGNGAGIGPTNSSWPGGALMVRHRPRPRPTSRRPNCNQRRSTLRIAIYARASTQRQAQTIEQQIERLRAHIGGLGEQLADETIFRDDGYSGATLRRPGLDRLRDRAALASFDRRYVTDPDRRARNYVHQVLLIEEFQQHGCPVEFLDR